MYTWVYVCVCVCRYAWMSISRVEHFTDNSIILSNSNNYFYFNACITLWLFLVCAPKPTWHGFCAHVVMFTHIFTYFHSALKWKCVKWPIFWTLKNLLSRDKSQWAARAHTCFLFTVMIKGIHFSKRSALRASVSSAHSGGNQKPSGSHNG